MRQQRVVIGIRNAILALGICAIVSGVTPTGARALSADYCGYLIPSTPIGGANFSCYGYWTGWTYANSRYNGSGNIRELRAALVNDGGAVYGIWAASAYATFTSVCYRSSGTVVSRGASGQSDYGANHTIYGRSDDSQNHTGCIL